MTAALSVREVFTQVKAIQNRFSLSADQLAVLYSAQQIDNILLAAHVGRWDQVTLMLLQEKVIEKWPV